MKKQFKRFKETLKRSAFTGIGTAIAAGVLLDKTTIVRYALANRSGEGYVDTAVRILISVVLGALLLTGLYALFGETVLPTETQRVRDMFNYGGS